MVKHSKNGKTSGIFGYVWNPFRHLLMATGESTKKVTNTVGSIAKTTLSGVEGVGSSFAKHSNMAVKGVMKGVTRRNRRSSRKSTRRNGRN